MSRKLNERELAEIKSVTSGLLDRLKKGYATRLAKGQVLVLGEHTVNHTWEIHFTRSLHSRGSHRQSLSPIRFFATSADGSLTLTVEDKQLKVRKPKTSRPLSMQERGHPKPVLGYSRF